MVGLVLFDYYYFVFWGSASGMETIAVLLPCTSTDFVSKRQTMRFGVLSGAVSSVPQQTWRLRSCSTTITMIESTKHSLQLTRQGHSPTWREVRAGTQGGKLEECCSLATTAQDLLCKNGPTYPRLGPPASVKNQNNPPTDRHAYRPAWVRQVLNWGSSQMTLA